MSTTINCTGVILNFCSLFGIILLIAVPILNKDGTTLGSIKRRNYLHIHTCALTRTHARMHAIFPLPKTQTQKHLRRSLKQTNQVDNLYNIITYILKVLMQIRKLIINRWPMQFL